mmetsp:Transcript_1263/g.2644  ORF Transcript_1263/g.2644 Transcript_1263/m.2644 type:complete len:203 (+) Transcript_1263:752-1360(+)
MDVGADRHALVHVARALGRLLQGLRLVGGHVGNWRVRLHAALREAPLPPFRPQGEEADDHARPRALRVGRVAPGLVARQGLLHAADAEGPQEAAERVTGAQPPVDQKPLHASRGHRCRRGARVTQGHRQEPRGVRKGRQHEEGRHGGDRLLHTPRQARRAARSLRQDGRERLGHHLRRRVRQGHARTVLDRGGDQALSPHRH